ncbi:MAG: GNAT family N-acetyltransferase [Anaerolineae bacterium]|nr:GNAT family N-acetyltransferase [Anaerolineae bacterium]
MIVTAPLHDQSNHDGPRLINLNRDIPQVMKLLELVFGSTLDTEGQRMMSDSARASQGPAFLWRLNPATSKLALGFVWEVNGRIVGNVTLLNTKTEGRYQVVNVAVHPDFRRRGIARGLMRQVTTMVRQRDGREIMLQVEKSNQSAITLYQSLGYEALGSMTNWQTAVSRLRAIPPTLKPMTEAASRPPVIRIRDLRRQEWAAAYALDRASLPAELNWPELPPPDFYKTSWWGQMANYVNGRRAESWVAATAQEELVGLVHIFSEWGQPHIVLARIHPAWRGQLERPLAAKMVRRLQDMPRRSIRLEHPDEDITMNELLREANFTPRRTLTHMRLTL